MTGEVIKSFLVGLGFGVDEASLAKFNKSIASATLRVTALYTSTKLAAAGIVYGISKISEGFEQMGYEYRIIAPAINKTLQLRRELLKAYSAAGINITKVIQSSVKLNFSLAKTKFAFDAIYKSVASKFFDRLTKSSDNLRQRLYANLPKIQEILIKLVNFVLKAFDAVSTLGERLYSILGRVYDFFIAINEKTNGWAGAVLALVAAWKFLNLSFLATPLGRLLALGLAVLALYDDFKTFQEGGQSFINWGSETTRIVVGLVSSIGLIASAIGSVIIALRAWAIAQAAVNLVMSLNPIGLVIAGITALIALITALDVKWNIFHGHVSGFFGDIGSKVLGLAGGNVAQNIQNAPGGVPAPARVGSNAQNSQTNQNVQQQTNINVQGVADAGAVGKAVSGEQGKVNFDLVRNLKGAVR